MSSKRAHNRLDSGSGRVLGLALSACLLLGLTSAAEARTNAARGKASTRAVAVRKITPANPRVQTHPANVALLAQGAKLHREGRVEEAEAIFKEVLIRDPQCVDAFYDLGAIAEGRGDFISALSHYHAALALRPGDREFKDAVQSVEKSLRKAPAKESVRETVKEPAKETASKEIVPVSEAGPEANKSAVPEVKTSDIAAAPATEAGVPVLTLPESSSNLDCEAAPRAVDAKTFQLSSRKGEALVPTLGVTQDQFPDIPIALSGRASGRNSHPPTLTVGQNNRSPGNGRMRAAASMILTVGAGAALNASGLHCPVCHMLRFRF